MLLLQMEKTYARGRGQKIFGTRWCGTVTLSLLKAFGFPSVACAGRTMGRSNGKAPHAEHPVRSSARSSVYRDSARRLCIRRFCVRRLYHGGSTTEVLYKSFVQSFVQSLRTQSFMQSFYTRSLYTAYPNNSHLRFFRVAIIDLYRFYIY
jgi:hypothetical protein